MNTPPPLNHIQNIVAYKKSLPIARPSGDEQQIVQIASNENAFGMSPLATEAIKQAYSLNRYPDTSPLLMAISKHNRISEDSIVLGNGSYDVLDIISRAFLGAGDEAISSQYGFLAYRLLTQISGAKFIAVKAMADYSYNLNGLLKTITPKTKVIWIDNPNNPTGTYIKLSEIRKFIKAAPNNIVIVLDEAYIEFLGTNEYLNSNELFAEFPNVIITRTFSKAYGLAGLRIGYGLAHPNIIEVLNRIRQPFNVNSVAIVAATAALKDQEFIKNTISLTAKSSKRLLPELDKLGIEYIPSKANFVTVKFDDAVLANEFLRNNRILVRPLTEYGLKNHLRITFGNNAENIRLLEALKTYISKTR